MKRIINGKLYNTDTAKAVKHIWCSGNGDFTHYSEALYRKRTGEYFLFGHGGSLSKYREDDIVPLTYEQAQAWAKAMMDEDEYLAEFGPVSNTETVVLSVSLPADVADRVRKSAASEGISVSECIGKRF